MWLWRRGRDGERSTEKWDAPGRGWLVIGGKDGVVMGGEGGVKGDEIYEQLGRKEDVWRNGGFD